MLTQEKDAEDDPLNYVSYTYQFKENTQVLGPSKKEMHIKNN